MLHICHHTSCTHSIYAPKELVSTINRNLYQHICHHTACIHSIYAACCAIPWHICCNMHALWQHICHCPYTIFYYMCVQKHNWVRRGPRICSPLCESIAYICKYLQITNITWHPQAPAVCQVQPMGIAWLATRCRMALARIHSIAYISEYLQVTNITWCP